MNTGTPTRRFQSLGPSPTFGGVVAILLAALLPGCLSAEILHRERSLYQTLLVDRQGSQVCLKFGVRRNQRIQSCIDQRRPRQMVFSYTRMMLAALLLNPSPRRVLFAGLGGGTLPTALAELYPEALIDVVEIDAAVVKVAEHHFGFRASERLRVHVQDARAFVKRAGRNGATYDLVILDAFNSDYIPEHLMTREFLLETRTLLSVQGVVAANTFATSRLYDHESATYADVFGPFFNLRLANTANRVILATTDALPNVLSLQRRAAQLDQSLKPYGVDILKYPKQMLGEIDWDATAQVLTDQYAPANLLR